MKKVQVLLLVLGVLVGVAVGDPVNPFNDRTPPVTVTVGASEPGLQDLLNQISGVAHAPNAITGQQAAGMWTVNGEDGAFLSRLRFEFAGNSNSNEFGMWFASSPTTDFSYAPIFSGSAVAGKTTNALVVWLTPTSGYVQVGGNAPVMFNSIPQSSFGFYLSGPGGIFYTVDSLNADGKAHALAYNDASNGLWILAFEDVNGGDNDFNDLVATVSNIEPVPEPASIALFGSGLLAAAGVIRRKLLG